MKNEFVPYDIALAMKGLGFDEKCFGAYGSLNNFELHLYKEPKFIDYTTSSDKSCLAPLYQQAFRWFREECDLEAHLSSFDIRWRHSLDYKEFFTTYKEAQDACLRKLIEIVKENKNDE